MPARSEDGETRRRREVVGSDDGPAGAADETRGHEGRLRIGHR